MKEKTNSLFKNLIQVGMVVSNLQTSMEKYVFKYGLGPMYVLEFNSNNVEDMMIYGKKKNYSMNLGVCTIGDVRFELIEPISKSIYSDYLNEYSDGIIHHLKLEVSDYFEAFEYFKSNGIKVIQHGKQLGDKGKNIYTYFDTRDVLGFIIEIVKITPDFIKPKPEYWFPKDEKISKNPFFKRVFKVGLVVKDLDAAIEKYKDLLGFNSWTVKEFNNKNLSDMSIYGKKNDYSVKVGYYKLGNVELALTEPLSKSIFSDFLEKYGENVVSYLGMEVENYNNALTFLNSKNIKIIQSGNYLNNQKYSYFSTNNDLNFIVEIAESKKSINNLP